MKPLLDASALQPGSGAHPTRPNGAEPDAMSLKSAAVAFGDQLQTAQQSQAKPLSSLQVPGRQGSVANADVALRVSVVDGADRMVYSDVRDRKGWAQPLAVNEALRDAGRRGGAPDVPTSPAPRVIRDVESRASGARSESVPTSSPYRVGKANVRSPALNAPGRVETNTPKELVATSQPSTVSRSR